jgi:hypothetical protein
MEIAFWELAILLLRDSRLLRRVICVAHEVFNYNRWILRIPKRVIYMGAMLGLGILIGFVGAMVSL